MRSGVRHSLQYGGVLLSGLPGRRTQVLCILPHHVADDVDLRDAGNRGGCHSPQSHRGVDSCVWHLPPAHDVYGIHPDTDPSVLRVAQEGKFSISSTNTQVMHSVQ